MQLLLDNTVKTEFLLDTIVKTESPLNYTGGKFKLLPQITELMPKDIDLFVDLFCGGCNVGLNVNSKKTIFNDNNKILIDLFKVFQRIDKETILFKIESIIKDYILSNSLKKGYAHYGCNSSQGLGGYNKEPFIKLRKDFNLMDRDSEDYFITLYVLIVFSFNNQIRFNRKSEFNLPVGKRDFNNKMRTKLLNFLNVIQKNKYQFHSFDFIDFDISQLTTKSFVYIDPPYLITCASYNENNGWNEDKEAKLLEFIDLLNNKKIKFGLSNVLKSRGKENITLINWVKNKKYKVHKLNFKYSNSNYQIKDKAAVTEEVFITNYCNIKGDLYNDDV